MKYKLDSVRVCGILLTNKLLINKQYTFTIETRYNLDNINVTK